MANSIIILARQSFNKQGKCKYYQNKQIRFAGQRIEPFVKYGGNSQIVSAVDQICSRKIGCKK
jgi:hypothetical protein